MNREKNIARFEAELGKVQRPGMDRLLGYIRKSDFYTAPASTKYHLSCEGGLLQHSLNVLDALRGMLHPSEYWVKGADGEEKRLERKENYSVSLKTVASFSSDTVTVVALLHDICKTYFYSTSTRNVKNEKTGKWEKVPYYTVNDRMPLGHGPKSAMIIKQYMELTTEEMYAIWYHMGFTVEGDTRSLSQAIDKFPLIWALHTADMMASHFMEGEKDNLEGFEIFFPYTDPAPESAGEYTDNPAAPDAGPQFEEAPPIGPGA